MSARSVAAIGMVQQGIANPDAVGWDGPTMPAVGRSPPSLAAPSRGSARGPVWRQRAAPPGRALGCGQLDIALSDRREGGNHGVGTASFSSPYRLNSGARRWGLSLLQLARMASRLDVPALR
jgi:hypothetical protein